MSTIKKITYLTVGQGINFLVNLIFMPYMARAMTYSEYGTYGQVVLVFSVTCVIFSFGLSQVIFVFLADKEKDSRIVLTSNLTASIISIALSFFFISIFKNQISNGFNNPDISTGLEIVKYSFFFFFFNSSLNAFLIGKGFAEKATKIIVIANSLKVILVILSVQLFGSLIFVFYSILIASFIQLVLLIYSTKSYFTNSFSSKLVFQQIKIGFPLAITGIFGMGILQADAVMVSSSFDVKDYAIYRNGAFEIPFFSTLYASIAAIIMPKVSELWKAGEIKAIIYLKRKVIINSMAIIYPMLFFFLINSRDIIELYLGDKYHKSAIIFLIFNLTLLIRINDYFDVLIASGKTNLILLFNVFVFIINLILNFTFIKIIGLPGAAVATVISLFIYAWIHLKYSFKTLETGFFVFFKIRDIGSILLISFALGIVSFSVTFAFKLNGICKIAFYGLFFLFPTYYSLIKINLIDKQIVNKLLPMKIQGLFK